MIRARTLLLTVGGVLGVAAGGMLLALVTALMYGGEDIYALLVATVVTSLGGALSWTLGSKWRKKKRAPAKAAFLVVSVGWLVMSGVGAMPYWLYAHLPRPFNSARAQKGPHTGGLPITRCVSGERAIGYEFCSLTNCLFESVSGFTTTGASIVTVGLWERPGSHSGLPRGILMWRAVTQWLGGMGIVLLALALFPFLGIGGYSLYRAEVPGPTKEKLTPRLTSTAAILWAVYGALTLLQIVLLWPVTGLYQAITHAFTTMATGGFSTLGASVAGFKSPYVEWVIITFMFLAGANFALHAWAIIKGRFSIYMKNSEFVAYTMFTLIVASVIAYVIQHISISPFRDSLFQTVS